MEFQISDHDDGTTSSASAAFLDQVIHPTIRKIFSAFDLEIKDIFFNAGSTLARYKGLETCVRSLAQQRDEFWEASLNPDKIKEFEILSPPEGAVLFHTVLIEGSCNDSKKPFSPSDQDITLLSQRLMDEIGRQGGSTMYLVGGYHGQVPFIDCCGAEGLGYEGSGRDKLWVFDDPFNGDIELWLKTYSIVGEAADRLRAYFLRPSKGHSVEAETYSLVDSLLPKVHTAFLNDPDIILGDPKRLILIRSGDVDDTSFRVSLEQVLLDEEGDPEEYEVLGSFGSSEEALKDALLEYLRAGGDVSFVREFA